MSLIIWLRGPAYMKKQLEDKDKLISGFSSHSEGLLKRLTRSLADKEMQKAKLEAQEILISDLKAAIKAEAENTVLPQQPFELLNDVAHFQKNSLVYKMFDMLSRNRPGEFSLQAIMRTPATAAEKEQFLQLIGVSVSVYGRNDHVSTASKTLIRHRVKEFTRVPAGAKESFGTHERTLRDKGKVSPRQVVASRAMTAPYGSSPSSADASHAHTAALLGSPVLDAAVIGAAAGAAISALDEPSRCEPAYEAPASSSHSCSSSSSSSYSDSDSSSSSYSDSSSY